MIYYDLQMTKQNRRLQMEKIVIIIAIIMIIGIAIWISDMNRFVVKPYEIKSKKVTKPYRFMVLSDLHGKTYGKNNQRLVNAIKKWNPDSIMIAGDMITGKAEIDYHVSIGLLEQLGTQFPIYYGLGNHESKVKNNTKTYKDKYFNYNKALENTGVSTLVNETINLPSSNIDICGVELDKAYFKRHTKKEMEKEYLESLIGKSKSDKFQILIAHNPEYFEEYVQWGADLILSGHIHGGIIKVPFLGGLISPAVKFFPEYDGGLYEKENKKMILSRGLGTHTLPIRILNPGELIAVTLLPDNQ